MRSRFKEERLKASEKPLTGRMELQDGSETKIVGNKVDEQYFLFSSDSNNFYFGKIFSEFDYLSLEKRDMEKPVRRSELAISPRLAKMMINISGVKERENLLDPFCGVGVFLYEALLKKISVFGIDNDKNAIYGCKENLEWGRFNPRFYELTVGNSVSFKTKNKFDAFVCEPDFGEILRKTPTENITKERLSEYEDLMISVLNNFKDKVEGRFVFTSPWVRLYNKKRKGCDVDRICKETKLNLVEGFPIDEFRKDQIVGRRIIVLEHK